MIQNDDARKKSGVYPVCDMQLTTGVPLAEFGSLTDLSHSSSRRARFLDSPEKNRAPKPSVESKASSTGYPSPMQLEIRHAEHDSCSKCSFAFEHAKRIRGDGRDVVIVPPYPVLGLLHDPMVAAAAFRLSSVLVVVNALRPRWMRAAS